ncbi:Ig-like domain repeat protein [Candidatus Bipolaricaulota bacterium]|nr:Ig-like domain repeat protein [Candidatus Bipolaricaulota bacterium]
MRRTKKRGFDFHALWPEAGGRAEDRSSMEARKADRIVRKKRLAAYRGMILVLSIMGCILLSSLAALAQVAPTVQLTLPSVDALIYEQVACQVTVSGGSGTPTGTVTFSDGTANGTFPSGATATLNAGAASVDYVPGANDAGTTTITATYNGDGTYLAGSASGPLNVVLRPTQTIVESLTSSGDAGVLLVNETGSINVTVKDLTCGWTVYAPPGTLCAPPGTLTLSQSLTAGVVVITPWSAFTPGPSGSSTAEYRYACTALDLDGDVDTISATYNPNDGIHAESTGAFGQSVQRRPTESSIDCTATAAGCDCQMTTHEEAGLPGVATSPVGQVIDTATSDVLVGMYTGGPSPVSVSAPDSIFVPVNVKYDPTDRVHVHSFASASVTRDNPAWLPSGGDCGDLNVQAILYGLNAGVFATDVAALALSLTGIICDMIPDIVVGAGFGVISGTTIPVSDIASAAIGFVTLTMDTYVLIATTDLDLDGLPGIVEAIMGTSDFDPDWDNDGLSDALEVDQADGYFSYDGGWECACPNPKDEDTDDDGLGDGDELLIYFTDPCNPDTDGDGVIDGVEVATWQSADDRDHADPLVKDSDGDGISDFWEMPLGCLGTPDPRDGFVNSSDSDGDGLRDNLDAYADLPDDPTYAFPGALYVVKVAGSGDNLELLPDSLPSIADEDSDGDGILDGFEHMRSMDFLDWDGDDDGRCDGHEVLGLGPVPTDPFDDDTDDDGVLDSAELWGSNPTNPVMPDTDGDGLCDGGANTPSGTGVNPLCSCTTGSASGIGDHPNPNGLGEDENGNGSWDVGETDPNRYDTDGDGIGDGIEKLGFSTSRQWMIPSIDMLGRAINVTYPACGCLDPLNEDTDGDGLTDGYEDANANGNFDFLPSDFDYTDPLPGPSMPDPAETNPCDPDTDNDGLSDYAERFQPNPSTFYSFNRTNPLDHDTDNDWLFDNEEIMWSCAAPGFDLDPDRDGVDEYYMMGSICDVLDPTNRDSDSDGIIDGLDSNPCYGDILPYAGPVADTRVDTDGDGFPDVIEIEAGTSPDEPNSHPPILEADLEPPLQAATVDTDGDGFSDAAELAAGTNPDDPDDYSIAFALELDLDEGTTDQLWLEDVDGDGIAESVALDIESNGVVDIRLGIVSPADAFFGDIDADGTADDAQYTVRYAVANSRFYHAWRVLVITDLDGDIIVNSAWFGE